MANKVQDQTPFFTADEITDEISATEDPRSVTKSVTTFKFGQDEFYVTQWKPARETPKAAIFICHGFGEYISSSYEGFARYLAKNGYYIFGHDHIGHGKTTGERVQASSVSEYVDPIIAHVNERKKMFPNMPTVILGHSMGGMITVMTVLKEPKLFDFVILMAPLVALNRAMASPMKIFVGKCISFLFPSFQMGDQIMDVVTRDKEWIRRLEEDQLFWQGRFKVQQSFVMLDALKAVEAKRGDFETPVLIQHGEKDSVCLASDSQVFLDSIKSEDKEIKLYPDAFHHLYIELEDVQEQVFKDTLDWLEKKVK